MKRYGIPLEQEHVWDRGLMGRGAWTALFDWRIKTASVHFPNGQYSIVTCLRNGTLSNAEINTSQFNSCRIIHVIQIFQSACTCPLANYVPASVPKSQSMQYPAISSNSPTPNTSILI